MIVTPRIVLKGVEFYILQLASSNLLGFGSIYR